MCKVEYLRKCLVIREKEKITLVLGDLHLGYEKLMQIGGVNLEEKRFREIIKEIKKIFEIIGKKCDNIIILGDLKNEFSKLGFEEREKILRFFDFLKEKTKENGKILVIRGNHDNYLKGLTLKKQINTKVTYFWEGNFFVHGDQEIKEMWGPKVKRIFIGHLHPSISLEDGVKREVFKCFLEGEERGKKIVVLPSFTEVGEGKDVREIKEEKVLGLNWKKFRVIVVGDDKNYDFGEIKDLR